MNRKRVLTALILAGVALSVAGAPGVGNASLNFHAGCAVGPGATYGPSVSVGGNCSFTVPTNLRTDNIQMFAAVYAAGGAFTFQDRSNFDVPRPVDVMVWARLYRGSQLLVSCLKALDGSPPYFFKSKMIGVTPGDTLKCIVLMQPQNASYKTTSLQAYQGSCML